MERAIRTKEGLLDYAIARVQLMMRAVLPDDFQDHPLTRKMSGYREFHFRNTPKGNEPNESSDVLVVYRIDEVALILIGIRY